jgi:hypothetical protein
MVTHVKQNGTYRQTKWQHIVKHISKTRPQKVAANIKQHVNFVKQVKHGQTTR